MLSNTLPNTPDECDLKSSAVAEKKLYIWRTSIVVWNERIFEKNIQENTCTFKYLKFSAKMNNFVVCVLVSIKKKTSEDYFIFYKYTKKKDVLNLLNVVSDW